jgi:hypothetical protein
MDTKERTVVFIKPKPDGMRTDNYAELDLIKNLRVLAQESSLHLVEEFSSELDKRGIDTIYKNLSERLRAATLSHMEGKVVRVFDFEGEYAIRRMQLIVGHNPNPTLCSPDSLRYEWWNRTKKFHVNPRVGEKGLEIGEQLIYWFNFLHCSRNEEEYKLHFAALKERKVSQ